MKLKFAKSVILVAGIVLAGSSYIAGLHAQQPPITPARPPATTNWIGYLVVGQNDTTDAVAIGGLVPTVSRHVEIGLRSDSVVVWRKVH